MGIEQRNSCNGAVCSFVYRGVCDRCGKATGWYPNVAGISSEGFSVDVSGGYGYRGVFCRGCRMVP